MNTAFPFERTDGYLHSQIRPTRSSAAPRPTPPFVTISREAGSGGSSLARVLARKLNSTSARDVFWRVYEENLTPRMLEAEHLSRSLARYLPEDRMAEPNATLGEYLGLHPNLWELVQKTNQALRDLARTGNAIFVGRGANFATATVEDGVHVRLIGSVDSRARFLAAQYNISEAEARKLNEECEARRRRYVRATFDADIDDPYAYDLIINTGKVSLADAAEMIVARVRQLEQR